MNIDSILNPSAEAASKHNRTPSVPTPYLPPISNFAQQARSWTTSPDTLYERKPQFATVNNSYASTSLASGRGIHETRLTKSSQSSPTMSAASSVTERAYTPASSMRSTPPTPNSPSMYASGRFPSMANGSGPHDMGPPRERREFRPTYLQEESFFIWYHRDDLSCDWSEVRNRYNEYFSDRQRSGFQGIQCKYYRVRSSYNVPALRKVAREASKGNSRRKYGVREVCPGIYYPWMDDHHKARRPRNNF